MSTLRVNSLQIWVKDSVDGTEVPSDGQMLRDKSNGRVYVGDGTSTVADLITAEEYLVPKSEAGGGSGPLYYVATLTEKPDTGEPPTLTEEINTTGATVTNNYDSAGTFHLSFSPNVLDGKVVTAQMLYGEVFYDNGGAIAVSQDPNTGAGTVGYYAQLVDFVAGTQTASDSVIGMEVYPKIIITIHTP